MGGLTWSLVQDPNMGNGSVLEYANKGIYDPVRKEIRYVGVGDTSPGGSDETKYLRYRVSTNQWSEEAKPFIDQQSHTWDFNAVNPVTGYNYIVKARTGDFWQWNGSSWSSIAGNSDFSAQLPACTWDETRVGLVCSARSAGVQIWRPSTGIWSSLGTPPGFTNPPYHQVIHYHRQSGDLLVGYGGNDPTKFWRLKQNGTFEALTAPTSLECCGNASEAKLTAFDYRTGKFLVLRGKGSLQSNLWEYNFTTNVWTNLGNRIPVVRTASSDWGIIVPIQDFGGVVLIIKQPGPQTTPTAYLYKHN